MWRLRGDYDNATTHLEQGLTLHRDIGHRNGEAEVLNELGQVFTETRGPAAAMSVYEEALKIARALSLPLEGAQALEGIARCHAKTANPEAALAGLREALTVYRRLGVPEERDAAGLLAELEGGSMPGQPV
ncbi:tetratricopeptide repeat protein [Streptomyces sp. NPDC085540]|uniref:tetratricopeptide repeat protein n=1 Tax=Streptomyces sp. NPDC085540 TaxID=3365730 RepID=UPI0037D395AE